MIKTLKTPEEIKALKGKERIRYITENQQSLEERYGDTIQGLVSESFECAIYGDPEFTEEEFTALGINPSYKTDFCNQTFEMNHVKIVSFIRKFLMQYGSFPQVSLIAENTELSRTTIYKHLEQFDRDSYRKIEARKIQIMRDSILGKLYFEALNNNNTKAAGLYLKYTQSADDPLQTTTNYIQINSIQLTQDAIEELPSESICEIEEIIKKSLIEIEQVNKG